MSLCPSKFATEGCCLQEGHEAEHSHRRHDGCGGCSWTDAEADQAPVAPIRQAPSRMPSARSSILSGYDRLDLAARDVVISGLAEAALHLAVGSVYLDPHTTAPDHLSKAYCSKCTMQASSFAQLRHEASCPVGQVLELVKRPSQPNQRLDAFANPSALVTGHAERTIVLDPVERPTATELA